MKEILVTGANGQLGSEFRILAGAYPQYHFTFIDIEDLDLTRTDRVLKFFTGVHPDIILNCAAYTLVDKAESDQGPAAALNVQLPEILASVAKRDNSLLIHYSTDYIFNGKSCIPYKELDSPDPQSFYGKSKLDGENAILINNPKAVIIRTSWLYSSFGKNFVKTILEKGREQQHLKVVYDQVGCPTYANDLALTTLELLPHFRGFENTEIFHYSDEGVISWYDFAIEILRTAKIHCSVEAVETKDYPAVAARPPYSVLSKSKIKELGVRIPYWKDSLERCLNIILKNKR